MPTWFPLFTRDNELQVSPYLPISQKPIISNAHGKIQLQLKASETATPHHNKPPSSMTLRALTPKFAMFAAPRRVLFATGEHVPRHLSRAQRLAPRLYSTDADTSSKTDDAKASNGEATATANATGNKTAAPKQAPRSSRTTSYSSGSRNSSSYKAGASSRKLASYSKPAAPSEPAQQADPEDSSESRPPRQSIYTPNLAQYDPPDKLPEDCTASSQVDWANSFFGISVQPATHKQFKQLSQPVHIEDIEVKPDGVIYLPEIKYRRKLNEVFGPMGWGLIPKGEPVVGSNIVTREYALIINGRYVSLPPRASTALGFI